LFSAALIGVYDNIKNILTTGIEVFTYRRAKRVEKQVEKTGRKD
jgi:hypothetical protein